MRIASLHKKVPPESEREDIEMVMRIRISSLHKGCRRDRKKKT